MSMCYNWILRVFENDINGRLRPLEIKNWITLYETVVNGKTAFNEDTLKSEFQRAKKQLMNKKEPLLFISKSDDRRNVCYSLTELGKEEVRSRMQGITPEMKHSDYVGTYRLGDSWEQFREKMIIHLGNMYEPQMRDMYQKFDDIYRGSFYYKKDIARIQSETSHP